MPWQLRKPELLVDEIRDIYEPRPDETFPYVGLEHINQQTLTLNGIGKSSDTQSSKRRFKTDDILFGTLRPYFRKVIKARFDGVCSTDIAVLRAKDPSDADFVLYFIANQGFIDYASAHSSGTRMPRANWKQLSQTKWPIPEKTERRALGYFLSVYDDLIENNTRRIRILEDMAQAIYSEWFINFRLPGHEKFEMVDSPLGNIPEGWEIVVFKHILESSLGGDWGKEEPADNYDSPVVVVRGADISDAKSGGPLDAPTRYITEASFEKRKLKVGDVVVENSVNASSRSVGTSLLVTHGLLNRLGGKAICASFCKCFRPYESDMGTLIHLHMQYLRSEGKMEYYQHVATNGIANFQGKRFIQTEAIAVPSDRETLTRLLGILSDLCSSIYADRICVLRQTRDLLLPRLISGELDVSELDIETGG